MPMLKGFTTYSSAPILSPSNMFFSSFNAVSRMIGMCDVSISFLIAAQVRLTHFRHHDVGDDKFSLYSLRWWVLLYRCCTSVWCTYPRAYVPNSYAVHHYLRQSANAVGFHYALFRFFVNVRRAAGTVDSLFVLYDLAGFCCQMRFTELFIVLGTLLWWSIRCSILLRWIFPLWRCTVSIPAWDQYRYLSLSNWWHCFPRKCILKKLLLFICRDADTCILYFNTPSIVIFADKYMYTTTFGVYFKAFEMIFLISNPFSLCRTIRSR